MPSALDRLDDRHDVGGKVIGILADGSDCRGVVFAGAGSVRAALGQRTLDQLRSN